MNHALREFLAILNYTGLGARLQHVPNEEFSAGRISDEIRNEISDAPKVRDEEFSRRADEVQRLMIDHANRQFHPEVFERKTPQEKQTQPHRQNGSPVDRYIGSLALAPSSRFCASP